MEGLSKLESEISQKSETIGAQYVLAAPPHMCPNEYLDSTSCILHFFPKVSAGMLLLSINPHSD